MITIKITCFLLCMAVTLSLFAIPYKIKMMPGFRKLGKKWEHLKLVASVNEMCNSTYLHVLYTVNYVFHPLV